jgi:very-short-patch-repair endonuclease
MPFGRYIVDFVCFDRRLIIEVDGEHHGDQVAYDTARTQWLESHGFRVLRFWNCEVLRQTEGVIEAIVQALRPTRSPRAHQPPTAPPDTEPTA